MKRAIYTLTAAAASATCYGVGFVPQYVNGLTFGEALRAMRMVGGSSNAYALMQFSEANAEALAAAGAAFLLAAVYNTAK